ncbi:glutamate synthase large subunit [Phycisphaerales bacterium AB-hyl4]|uniref:Glutamate synthase large subunit n=1 Tax=Natronomicrosphaera hydrolytica TaxID=3242702 RepID=A0ABV4U9E6_9BACT
MSNQQSRDTGRALQPIRRPEAGGLYDPAYEHDNCGVGFIAHIKGKASHDIVRDALHMLQRMDHRGACGCEPNTGDGAGIMTALPHALLRKAVKDEMGIDLPDPDAGRPFAAGNVFLPRDEAERKLAKEAVEKIITEQGQTLLGWRKLPVDPDGADVGPTARSTEPYMEQLFVGAAEGADALDGDAFERQVYLIRKRASHAVRSNKQLKQGNWFYICSLSTKVIVYKGQLTSGQVPLYYRDLQNEEYVSHLAMVHSRFSTNTFPSWDRAQPCRFMSHNGEINTLRGNINWMRAREGLMRSDLLSDDLQKLYPIVEPDCSDSGTFDNVLEMLLMTGRSLPEAVMMMIPEAWEENELMNPQKRAFYEYHSSLMEPWDGPASVAFTDGKTIGATLDRNGLRPSRYYVTDDDRVIMASEVGVVEIDPSKVKAKGRLQPGRMFLVDFDEGRIVSDEEVKGNIIAKRPYGQWLQQQRLEIADFEATANADEAPKTPTAAVGSSKLEARSSELLSKLQAFGYTTEHIQLLMLPMVEKSQEATGSMGNDTALAVLSDKPRLIYDYFKQLFAQVTNPPIDPIREEIIMSLQTYIGPEGNLLETTEQQCHRLFLPQPVLTDAQTATLKQLDGKSGNNWRTKTIDITYPRPTGSSNGQASDGAMTAALDRICEEASQAIADGYQLIVLSDRATGHDRIPLSSLLATGAVHHHLVRHADRTKIGIIVESGEAREVHHFCLLVGYGADAINPYLAYEALYWAREEGMIDGSLTHETIVNHFIKAVNKGILKVMSKMGISTLASYKGAQIFEALGLKTEIVERCFAGTASRLQGVGFNVLATEAQRRHAVGYPPRSRVRLPQLPNPGDYHWRADGERHAVNPTSIATLQAAARTNSRQAYDQFAKSTNEDARARCTLRGLLKLRTNENKAIPLEEVEPASAIVKRFRSGAMSLGALSREAHETLALAMNRLGGQSNSGEGGEDPVRFSLMPSGDSKRSAIKQIASGRFGVTSYYLANADTLQIKVAQGAKPGEGGQLPGYKVDDYIARLRYSTPGVGLISPPPHHDIYSIEDLAQLIYDLKNANPNAQISVKLVSEVGVGTVAAGVSKAHADHILVSGHDGGTGASPLTSIKHAGLPWELGIAETHQTLVLNDLRSRVRLETDGGLRTGRDVIIAACLGAEEYGFATTPLIAVGCIMMRKCHLNTCPVGICTQDPALRKKFSGQPEHVVNYMFLVAEEARKYMAELGIRTVDELIGRVDLLESDAAIRHWKSDGLDLAPILKPADKPRPNVGVRKLIAQDHGLANVLDNKLVQLAEPALQRGERVEIDLPIENLDRAVGATLSYNVSSRYGDEGLANDTINVRFAGHAGQSLGAFLAPGITFRLEGDANDYVGKGLSGGKLIVYPPEDCPIVAEENIIAGNVCLYGATKGEAYFRGVVAERFCVRNSGAIAVVEGVGDHGCEYMTGGRVVILGKTGRNFAAGMSGGIAYVWDPNGELLQNCNLGMVDLEKLEAQNDIDEVQALVRKHMEYTGSSVAAKLLTDWDRVRSQFVKVMPIDYRRVLQQRQKMALQQNMPEVGHG